MSEKQRLSRQGSERTLPSRTKKTPTGLSPRRNRMLSLDFPTELPIACKANLSSLGALCSCSNVNLLAMGSVFYQKTAVTVRDDCHLPM
jgi:hypothetical protein